MQLKLLGADILREKYVLQYFYNVLRAGDGKIDENRKPKEIWIALWKLSTGRICLKNLEKIIDNF